MNDTPTTVDGLPPGFCPYVGLQPYAEKDREFFFGRERDVAVVAANLYASPLTILYGASGVGKSSVLQAGVVPDFRNDPHSAVVVFRDWQDDTFRLALKQKVHDALARLPGREMAVDLELPLDELLALSQAEFFFVFDQFEEYFLYHPADASPEGFEAEFARAVNRDDVDANFLIAIREDGLSKLDRFQGRIPNLLANRLQLDHLDRAGAEDAIRKPLELYNKRRDAGSPEVILEDALVSRVIEQIGKGRVVLGDAGKGQLDARSAEKVDDSRIETPFLQMVMTRLWDESMDSATRPPGETVTLKVDLLDHLGGAERIVRSHLDEVMESELEPDDRDIAARLFRFLVTPTGSKIAHTVGDLASYVEQPPGRVKVVLNRLGSSRMLILRSVASPTGQAEATRFEIFHDVLASAVLDWGRRHRQEAELADTRREAEEQLRRAEEAESREREAEATARRHKQLSLRFLSAATLSGLFALAALWQTTEAYKAQETAAAALVMAKQTTKAAKESEEKAKIQSRIATSRQLAFASVSQQDKRYDCSLLLAVAALKADNTFEARDNLFKALQQRPGLLSFLHISEGAVRDVAFSPNGLTLAAGYDCVGGVGGVVVWDASTRRRIGERLEVKDGYVRSVAFSPDGKTLAAGYYGVGGGGVVMWDTSTRRRIDEPFEVKEGGVWSVAFSPDGLTLAAGYDGIGGGGVVMWDAAARRRMGEPLEVKPGGVQSVVFSPDGLTLAAGYAGDINGDGGVWVWDVAARRRIGEPFEVKGGVVLGLAFSPDGRSLAAGYASGVSGGVLVWDATAPRQIGEPLEVKEGRVWSVAFSPDGKALAAGYHGVNGGGGVVMWDASAPRRIDEPFEVKEGGVWSVAFSPDGKTFAAGYHGAGLGVGGVVVWDAAARRRIGEPLEVKEGGVLSVSFSPSGGTLAAGYGDIGHHVGGVVLWDIDLESWQRIAGRLANRNFTRAEWRQYFPDEPYRAIFPDLPVPPG